MEWNVGDNYFIKLVDGTCINGVITSTDNSLGFLMIEMIDKYGKTVGFRADDIKKYELLTKRNTCNNMS
jgi:hypothetical protein